MEEGRKKKSVRMAEQGDIGGQGKTDSGGIETRRQNEDRTWTKLSAGRKERQVEVKVGA